MQVFGHLTIILKTYKYLSLQQQPQTAHVTYSDNVPLKQNYLHSN